MSDRAMVANAADAKQVKNAGRKEKDNRERELDDLRKILEMSEGRRLLWRLIGISGYAENPSHPRGDVTNQNIGKADMGRIIISEIGFAGGIEAWLLMQREAWMQKQREQVEAEAVRTPSALSGNGAQSQ